MVRVSEISSTGVLGRLTRSRGQFITAVVLLLGVGLALLPVVHLTHGVWFLDLQIYRAGGWVWLNGQELYAKSFPQPFSIDFVMPFTYPPLAAVLFSPLAMLPFLPAVLVFALVSLTALFATCAITVRQYLADRRVAIVSGALFGLGCIAMEPVWETLGFGQINLVLMALVIADCVLPRTPWPRGMLIGIAAAIKLTPAAFLLFFIAGRQWRPLVVAAASFVGAGALGFLFAWTDSVQYWLGVLADAGRIGGAAWAQNQTFRGVMTRMGIDSGALWLVLVGALVAAAWFAAARLRARGEHLTALLVIAAAALVGSPVSWSHHWVWVAPAVVALACRWWQDRRLSQQTGRPANPWLGPITIGLFVIFTVGPYRLMPRYGDLEYTWSAWQHVVGNAYVVVALVFVGWAVVRAARPALAGTETLTGDRRRDDVK